MVTFVVGESLRLLVPQHHSLSDSGLGVRWLKRMQHTPEVVALGKLPGTELVGEVVLQHGAGKSIDCQLRSLWHMMGWHLRAWYRLLAALHSCCWTRSEHDFWLGRCTSAKVRQPQARQGYFQQF